MKHLIKKDCLICKKKIIIPQNDLKYGRGKFCSKKCHFNWMRNNLKGRNNHRWKGGRNYDGNGYILIYSSNHPNKNYSGYIFEHHLIMEKYLGRYLSLKEEIHHINGIKDDNRIENLKLMKNKSEHRKLEHYEGKYKLHMTERDYLGRFI